MKANVTATTNATAETRPTFEDLKRNLENTIANGQDNAAPLMELSTTIAKAVINKCLDPQRTTAPARETVSNNGGNPMLLQLKNTIRDDTRILKQTQRAAAIAYELKYNQGGDLISEVADENAAAVLDNLASETLSDALDLAHTAAAAILEQYAQYYDGQENFLDWTYTTRRLSKRVYIQAADSAKYSDVETTPIQEVYREVRREIMASRAVQTDPRNGYTYIEDLTIDGLDTVYRRMQKYADIGGKDINGLYTTDSQSIADYDTMIQALNLTPRQLTIVNLRMRGNGYKAIATYLGVTHNTIVTTLKRIQEKAADLGYTPK